MIYTRGFWDRHTKANDSDIAKSEIDIYLYNGSNQGLLTYTPMNSCDFIINAPPGRLGRVGGCFLLRGNDSDKKYLTAYSVLCFYN